MRLSRLIPKETPNEILHLHVSFFIYIIQQHLKSDLKSSFQSYLLVLFYDFLTLSPLPWVPLLDIFSDFTHRSRLIWCLTLKSPQPRQHHRWGAEGRGKWEGSQPDCLDAWGKWLPFPTLSFILVKMKIIVVAPSLLLWGLNKLIVSGTQ